MVSPIGVSGMLVGVLMLKLKKGLYNYVRVRVTGRLQNSKFRDEFLGHVVMLVTRAMFNQLI